MQFQTTFALLALLASPALGLTQHHNAARARDLIHKRRAGEMNSNLDITRSFSEKPKKMVKKRGAKSTCRPRGESGDINQVFTSSTTEQQAAATPTATATAGDNYDATAETTTSSAAAAASSSSSGSSSGSTSNSGYTPSGIKAGMSLCSNLQSFTGHISWCYDWTPNPDSGISSILSVPMIWGNGHLGGDENDASRVAAFKDLSGTPPYIIGFEEPDCSTTGSSAMSVSDAASAWDSLMASHTGSTLLGPSMCHQADEDYLTPFDNAISVPYQIVNLHTNKNSMDGIKKDIDHYWNTYQKPMWVTEFACVDDSNGFTPCSDQGEIDSFINQIVDLFESDSRIYAYAMSAGEGLGNVWPPFNSDGSLSASGQTYLNAVSKYH